MRNSVQKILLEFSYRLLTNVSSEQFYTMVNNYNSMNNCEMNRYQSFNQIKSDLKNNKNNPRKKRGLKFTR